MNSHFHPQYKQFVQTVKNQNNKIKSLESELSQHKVNVVNLESVKQKLNSRVKELEEKNITSKNELEVKSKQFEYANQKIDELSKELVEKSAQLESANQKIDEVSKELIKKSAQLESANKKIDEMTSDLDKRNDVIYQIDKIILRNNDYFDEVKKELNDKIACGKEMTELYQNTNNELLRVRNEMELLCKELDETKRELQLYKNDFILKSATF